MNVGLTLLTATGARPQAWAICEKLMAAQTYAGAVRWIIVDDGEQPQPVTFRRAGWDLTVIRPQPYWARGQNTQARNLLAGLACVNDDDRVVIIEDDDHYAATWLEVVDRHLDRAELVGETRARYYNVALRRARQLNNAAHSSLCSTGLRDAAIAALRSECRRAATFIDLGLWRRFAGSKLLFSGHRVTGIKGLPGRGGIGMGHCQQFNGQPDPELEILREWIGPAAEWYVPAEAECVS